MRVVGSAARTAPIDADRASERLGADGSFVLIGEALHGDYSQLVNPGMLDSCTNYECYKGLYSSFNSKNMFEIAHSLHRQFGDEPCVYRGLHLLSFADNHDVTRLASILEDPACIRPAYGMLFGMPGIPCLYYGSEWGATGRKGSAMTGSSDPPSTLPRRTTSPRSYAVSPRCAPEAPVRGRCRTAATATWSSLTSSCSSSARSGLRGLGPRGAGARRDQRRRRGLRLQCGELAGSFVDLLAGDAACEGRAAEGAGVSVIELGGSLHMEPYEVRFLLVR